MVSSFRQELMKSLARHLRSNVYLAANTRGGGRAKTGKGVTLSKEELLALKELLNTMDL